MCIMAESATSWSTCVAMVNTVYNELCSGVVQVYSGEMVMLMYSVHVCRWQILYLASHKPVFPDTRKSWGFLFRSIFSCSVSYVATIIRDIFNCNLLNSNMSTETLTKWWIWTRDSESSILALLPTQSSSSGLAVPQINITLGVFASQFFFVFLYYGFWFIF